MIRFLLKYLLTSLSNKSLLFIRNIIILPIAYAVIVSWGHPTSHSPTPTQVRRGFTSFRSLLLTATSTHIKIFIILLLPLLKTRAQCPTANFTLPDTVCQNESFSVTNNSTNAVSYEWDFCAGDLLGDYSINNLGDITSAKGPSSIRVLCDTISNVVKWVGFITSYIGNQLLRVYMGSDIFSPDIITQPIQFPQGVSISNPGDIRFHRENNNWYGLLINQGGNNLLLLKFGTNVTYNNPTVIDLQDLGGHLNRPWALDIAYDNNIIYVIITNAQVGFDSITIARFENSIESPPQVKNIGTNGVYNLIGLDVVQNCGNWFAFLCVFPPFNTILRINFGNSLWNDSFSVVNLNTNFGVTNPLGINFQNEQGNWLAFVSSYDAPHIARVNFGENITNPSPSISYSSPAGGISPHVAFMDFTKIGSKIFGWGLRFVSPPHLRILWRLEFPDSCGTTTPISTQQNPSPVIYDIPADTVGQYYVSLYAYDNNGNFDCHQDSITVLPALNVDFTAINTPICSDTFTFTSIIQTPETTNTYLWNFGDGTTSTEANPTHVYQYPGVYQVTLTCNSSVWLCPGTATHTVENNKAYPDFYVDTGFVVPPLEFTDLTPDPYQAIDSWFWDFGDGSTSTLQNPTHTYDSGGFYDVMLVVTINNCKDTVIKTIPYTPKPNIQFTVANNCDGDTTWFYNTTEFPTVTDYIETYIWNYNYPLGDFDTIPADSLTTFHFYSDTGNYIVMLQVITNEGLTDSLIDTVRIYPKPIPNFSVPALVCEDASIQFFDSSSVPGPDTITGWIWAFGDGDSAFVKNPFHTFDDTGTYCVTLTVFSGTDCDADTTICIVVTESPKAGFTFDHTCIASVIQFYDTSTTPTGTTITSWFWNFGDGETSTLQSPTHIYNTDTTFIITLTVTSNANCSGSVSDTFTVSPLPVADFIPLQGCDNSAVPFIDISTIENDSIVSWFWDFDDGEISNSANPSHLFDSAGSYNVTLVVTSNKGCKDTVIKTVQINSTPDADFTYLSNFAGNTFSFSDVTPEIIINWHWNFGDGEIDSLQNPTHTYYTGLPFYEVTLIVQSVNGCYDTVSQTVQVLNKEIVADFIGDNLCVNTPYQFFDSSYCINCSIILWNWNFNNEGNSTQQNPIFTFDSAGIYWVTLEVQSQEGEPDTITKTITVHENPVANFTFTPSFGAPPLEVSFTCDTTKVDWVIWDFGDGASDTINSPPFNTTHIYADSNIYQITLYVFSEYGCSDTAVKEIKIMKPILDVAVADVFCNSQNNKLSISTNLLNLGTRNIDSLLLYAEIEGGSTIIEKWYGPLYSGQNTLYNFVASFDISVDISPSYICVHALFENPLDIDYNPLNNHQCKSLNDEFIVIVPYPNPANNTLTLEYILPFSEQVEISIFNSIGQKVYSYSGIGNKGLNILSVDMKNFASGIYISQVIFNESSVVKRFVRY